MLSVFANNLLDWLKSTKERNLRGRFNYLLVSLLLILGAYPYLQGQEFVREAILQLLISAAFLSAMYAMSDHQRRLMTAVILGAPGILLSVKNFVSPSQLSQTAEHLLLLPFYVYTIVIIIRSILTSKKVSQETMVGAVCVYLLMGITWGDAYTYLEKVHPGSFHVNESHHSGGDITWSYFLYFSFSTLTTLGYGDITPRTPQARSLTLLESATGVLYVAILISRLVALYRIEHQETPGGG